MKRYLVKHLQVAGMYIGMVMVIWLVKGRWTWSWDFVKQVGWWVGGVVVGVWLLFLDRIVYVFAYPEEQLSRQFVYWWQSKRYGQALASLYTRREEQVRLTMRSALFLLVWAGLGLFGVTSVPSYFGRGVVMGGWWHVLYDSWRLQRMDESKLNQRLFWQVKKKVSKEEQWLFLVGVSLLFGVVTFLV